MGLFSKKKQETVALPKLPEVPSLPVQFPTNHEVHSEPEERHELPTFPNNSFGEKFSQNTIKNAVEGDREESPQIQRTEIPMPPIPKPQISKPKPQINKIPELPEDPIIPSLEMEKIEKPASHVKRTEPVFIRVDKFEDGLKIFDKTKDRISEIEVLLKETKELKQKEEEELSLWEKEIQEMKKQIEKVDQDIFSTI